LALAMPKSCPPWRPRPATWLLDGQFARAAEVAKLSSQSWPSDPLTLLVLARAEDGLGQTAEARRDDAGAIGNWGGDIAKVDILVI
jgi:hypothetical protein